MLIGQICKLKKLKILVIKNLTLINSVQYCQQFLVGMALNAGTIYFNQ